MNVVNLYFIVLPFRVSLVLPCPALPYPTCLSCARTHTYTQTHTHTHTHTHTNTRTYAHTHTRAQARTHTHAHTNAHGINYSMFLKNGHRFDAQLFHFIKTITSQNSSDPERKLALHTKTSQQCTYTHTQSQR